MDSITREWWSLALRGVVEIRDLNSDGPRSGLESRMKRIFRSTLRLLKRFYRMPCIPIRNGLGATHHAVNIAAGRLFRPLVGSGMLPETRLTRSGTSGTCTPRLSRLASYLRSVRGRQPVQIAVQRGDSSQQTLHRSPG
jgi:hypothetical protein